MKYSMTDLRQTGVKITPTEINYLHLNIADKDFNTPR